jgi:hypothetical protein
MKLIKNKTLLIIVLSVLILFILFLLYIVDTIYDLYCQNNNIKCNFTTSERIEFQLITFLTFIILSSISIFIIINFDICIDKLYLCIKKKCNKCNKCNKRNKFLINENKRINNTDNTDNTDNSNIDVIKLNSNNYNIIGKI